MTGIAAQGALLFLFIPLVLFLFLRQPLGPGWSVLAGLAIMFGHRLVASPWMAKWADVRCLWCGRAGAGRRLIIVAGGREWRMTACTPAHAALVGRVLNVAFRHRVAIALGVFLPLAWLLFASVAAAAGHQLLRHEVNALIFRIIVAATVVAASIVPMLPAGAAARAAAEAPDRPLRCPFPLHNFFLLGLGRTLWVFRFVGAWWLVDGAIRLAR